MMRSTLSNINQTYSLWNFRKHTLSNQTIVYHYFCIF